MRALHFPLFRAARAYAEQSYDAWLILSAKHGALRPTTLLAPYDFTLAWLSRAQRQAWAVHVVGQLAAIFGDLDRCAFGLHAGLAYRDPLCPYLPSWSAPLQGLGIGQQLAWYRGHVGLIRRELPSFVDALSGAAANLSVTPTRSTGPSFPRPGAWPTFARHAVSPECYAYCWSQGTASSTLDSGHHWYRHPDGCGVDADHDVEECLADCDADSHRDDE